MACLKVGSTLHRMLSFRCLYHCRDYSVISR